MGKRVLAFDFGASSGRAMLCSLEDGKLRAREVHRFANEPVSVGKRLYWDVLRLFHEMKQGILLANQAGGFDAIGIDTWGVDFGLLDADGELLANPAHYRDQRTDGMPAYVFSHVIDKAALYRRTGIQCLNFNTLYQLAYLKREKPALLEQTEKLLLIPDLFAYFLTGNQRTEYTNATTTNLLDPVAKTWDQTLIGQLGLPRKIFPDLIFPTQSYGMLRASVCEELHCESVPVIAVATHDTGSAVVSVPAQQEDYAYISCGTWSLFGTVCDAPMLGARSEALSFTNEGAADGKIRLLKNIMGLWLIQQSRAEWKRQGMDVSFDEMERQAYQAPAFTAFIDPDAPLFAPPGNMPERVAANCVQTGQTPPQGMGPTLRCIYESLALKYRYTLQSLQSITGKTYDCIYMIGGGIKDALLCSMTADACGIPVKAGPVEATVTGNAVVQLMALGEIGDMAAARQVVQNSAQIKTYLPASARDWDAPYARFRALLSQA